MGNTPPPGYTEEADHLHQSTDSSNFYPQKQQPTSQDPTASTPNNPSLPSSSPSSSQDPKKNEDKSFGSTPSMPNRVTRNVTHTTNTTYDDTASLSTCATNTIYKTLSNDGHSIIDDQFQKKLQISSTTNDKAQSRKSKFGGGLKQVVGVMYTSSLSSSTTSQLPSSNHGGGGGSARLSSLLTNHKHHPNNNNDKKNNKRHNNNIKSAIKTAQDQWQSAWEEDDESSSDDEDNKNNNNKKNGIQPQRSSGSGSNALDNNNKHKPTSRRIKSDTILSKKVMDALLQMGNQNNGNNSIGGSQDGTRYEKPNIMMFFPLLRVLGKGSFGKVVLVQKRTGEGKGGLFAMKILRKSHLLQRGQIERTRTERKVLAKVNHPFIMKLHFAFQSQEKLFLVLDYCAGGELFFHLSRHRRFPEKWTRFYAAELLLALGHLHSHGIIYRDIKPENVLLDSDGHLKLGDFGLAKTGIEHPFRGASSRVGTPEYMSPEILQQKGHGFCVDYWGLGMLTYEMMTGLPPWYTTDRQKLFKRLNHAPLDIPPYFSPYAAAFCSSLLQRDPRSRLGVRGNHSAKSHEFFRRLDFKALLERQIDAPILPCEGWKPPEPVESRSAKAKRGIIRGIFGNNLSNNHNINNRNTPIAQIPSEELDAATANFDKQFTRMSLSSVSGHGDGDTTPLSDKDDGSEELNENTFVGFTFDDYNVIIDESFGSR